MRKTFSKKARLRKKFPTMSLGAAMADIALLLLIFYMATTTTEPPKSVEVYLPESISEGVEQDNIYLTVSKTGQYYYDGQRILLPELKELLDLRQDEKNKIVAISADRNLNFEWILSLLEVLKKSDFLNVVFMSQPRKTRP